MDSKIARRVYAKLKGELPKIEIRERRIYPKEVYAFEDVLSAVSDDEREFVEFIFESKEKRLRGVTSTRKFKRFKSAYIELFTTFTIAVMGGTTANAIWGWIKKRFESARAKEVRTIFRVKISYREQERTFVLEEPHVRERLIQIEKAYEELTKS